MTRGERAPLVGGRQTAILRRIEHDEVVAQAVHLGELELHAGKNTVASACMRLAPWLLAALVLFALWKLYSGRDIDHPPGILAAGGSRDLGQLDRALEHHGAERCGLRFWYHAVTTTPASRSRLISAAG